MTPPHLNLFFSFICVMGATGATDLNNMAKQYKARVSLVTFLLVNYPK